MMPRLLAPTVALVLLAVMLPLPVITISSQRVPTLAMLLGAVLVLLLGVVWPVSPPLALGLLWATARMLYQGTPDRSLILLVELLALAVLYALAAGHGPPALWRWAGAGALVAATLQTAVGLDQAIRAPLTAPSGLLYHSNYFGLLLALAFPLLIHATRTWAAPLRLPLLGAWVVLVLAARTRAAIAGVLVVGALALWRPLSARVGPWCRAMVLFGVAGWALAGLQLARPAGWARLDDRLHVWQILLVAWWTNDIAWLGAGLGFWRVYALWIGSPLAGNPWFTEAHNEPLQLLFELGPVGLGLGLWWWARILAGARRLWRLDHDDGRAWAGVVLVGSLAIPVSAILHVPEVGLLLMVAAARAEADRA